MTAITEDSISEKIKESFRLDYKANATRSGFLKPLSRFCNWLGKSTARAAGYAVGTIGGAVLLAAAMPTFGVAALVAVAGVVAFSLPVITDVLIDRKTDKALDRDFNNGTLVQRYAAEAMTQNFEKEKTFVQKLLGKFNLAASSPPEDVAATAAAKPAPKPN